MEASRAAAAGGGKAVPVVAARPPVAVDEGLPGALPLLAAAAGHDEVWCQEGLSPALAALASLTRPCCCCWLVTVSVSSST